MPIGSLRREVAITGSRLPSLRLSGMVSQTPLLDYYRGSMRSSSFGRTITHGMMMKVSRPSLSRMVDRISLSCSTVLTWISIYWFSRAGPAASLRIYYEALKADPQLFTTVQPTTIPLGYSYFPRELMPLPRRYVLVLGIYKTQLTAPILTFFLI